MAIIYTYPQKSQPVGADTLLITDSEDSNATKTVTIADIRDATVSGVESLIAGDNITLDPAGGTGNVTVSTTGEAERIVEVVYNSTGNTINKGQPLHITGVNGTIPTVNIADASDPTLMPVSGLANEDIPTMSSGEMIVSGILEGINTNGIDGVPTNAEAVIIYVSDSTGGSIDYLSANAPAGEANQVQNIGIIVKDSPGTSGSLQVTAIGRSNATPNLDRGSIFIGDALNQSSTLAIGADTHVLTSNGATASWAAIPTQAAEDLATTLAAGNTTGGNDISITSGDSIVFSNVPWAGELSVASLTANRTYALPNQSGTLPVGPAWNSLISTVTSGSGQDGYVITWNDASNEYQLLAAGSGDGIYGGSGSLPVGVNIATMASGSSLKFSSAGDSNLLNIGVISGNSTIGIGGINANRKLEITTNDATHYYGLWVENNQVTSTSFGYGIGGEVNSANNSNTGLYMQVAGGLIENKGLDAVAFGTTKNIAGSFSAINGTTNYAIIASNGQSGFGTTTPDPSAIVDVSSTTQAFYPPRMTTTQMNAIAGGSPNEGAILFDTVTKQFMGYNGTSWVILG